MPDFRPALSQFQQAIEERLRNEAALAGMQTGGQDAQENELRAACDQARALRDEEVSADRRAFQTARSELQTTFGSQIEELEQNHRRRLQEIERRAADELNALARQRQDSEWVVTSVLDDTADDSPVRAFERFRGTLAASREEQAAQWASLESDFEALVQERGLRPGRPLEPERLPQDRESAAAMFSKAVEAARQELNRTRSLLLPRLFIGFRPFLVFLVLMLATALPVGLLVDPAMLGLPAVARTGTQWIGIALGSGAASGLLLTGILFAVASLRQLSAFRDLHQAKSEAGWYHQKWIAFAREQLGQLQADCEAKQRLVNKQREATLQRYEQAHQQRIATIQQRREAELAEENEQFSRRWGELTRSRDEHLAALETDHQSHSQQLSSKWDREISRRDQALARYVNERQRRQAELWMATRSSWEQSCQQLQEALSACRQESEARAPAWSSLLNGRWQPPEHPPQSLRIGTYEVNLEDWEGACSADMRLAPRVTRLQLPAELPFPEAASLLLKSRRPEGHQAAVQVLRTAMLRLLTAIPPGKLRFTIIDPVSLGESFAGFMHLADFDEMIVTSRIWTEPGHIEARLADLTEHMENILQKYLRNEFATIEEYNVSAGEVAEPYHFLVITDFPNKFSEIAARRLASIVQSGPRCGVYTLMSLDAARQLPNNFELSGLEAKMTVFEWRESAEPSHLEDSIFDYAAAGESQRDVDDGKARAVGSHPDVNAEPAFYARSGEFSRWPLQVDAPPPPDQFVEIVRRVGESSKDARRVEVAFDRIAPRPERFWTLDGRNELEVPLGRAGATKLQTMKLGKGTSQHMLIAGKTGSGKSTFLHILITNLALHYSPDEVNFYLIDFKKGVEFKDYASLQLPHARVIAIESDREFGVSALQKLDAVLQQRGELFRRHGVQDIAGFRNANPGEPLPRILLIIDEFQEFFIEDDRLSQAAALLLDRLVRQGRAFGIHVVLGSQTLGGAYSLARTTLGQVAVRVALQCSEADAHLILSEENTAARLLSRPGEAIYNDANGLLEGNHPFQIAWLSDDLREDYLKQVDRLARRRQLEIEPAIVFEGNVPSDLTRNARLLRLASEFPARSEPITAPTLWLGDAVEIKPATSLTLHRQAGNNLLLVGQDAEAAQGVMAAVLAAAAASLSPRNVARPSPPKEDLEVTGTGERENGWPQAPSSGHRPSPRREDRPGPGDEPASAEANLPGPPAPDLVPALTLLDGSPHDTLESQAWRTIADALPVEIELAGPRHAQAVIERLTEELKRREASPEAKFPPMLLLIFNLARFRDLRKAEDEFGFGSFGGSGEPKPAEPGKLFADLLSRGPENGIHTILWCDSYNNVDRWFSRQTMRDLEQRVAFQMNAADSSNLIDSPLASRLGTHRALLYREETGTTEKFRPYALPSTDWWEALAARMLGADDSSVATSLEEFSIL